MVYPAFYFYGQLDTVGHIIKPFARLDHVSSIKPDHDITFKERVNTWIVHVNLPMDQSKCIYIVANLFFQRVLVTLHLQRFVVNCTFSMSQSICTFIVILRVHLPVMHVYGRHYFASLISHTVQQMRYDNTVHSSSICGSCCPDST